MPHRMKCLACVNNDMKLAGRFAGYIGCDKCIVDIKAESGIDGGKCNPQRPELVLHPLLESSQPVAHCVAFTRLNVWPPHVWGFWGVATSEM